MNKPLTDQRAIRLKRLRFVSWHRGCKETDLILGTFSDRHLETLDNQELDLFEALLEEDDAAIWAWLAGREPAPEKYAALLARMDLHTI